MIGDSKSGNEFGVLGSALLEDGQTLICRYPFSPRLCWVIRASHGLEHVVLVIAGPKILQFRLLSPFRGKHHFVVVSQFVL